MDENKNNFEIISGKIDSGTTKKSNDFAKSVLLPFFSGIVGCSVVIGTCFGVPSVKEKLIGTNNTVQTSTSTKNQTSSGGSGTTANFISLSNYSNTAVFAANKILPSIVGIEITYNVTSNSFFGFGQPTTSSAKATGSGIIISEDGYIVTNNHVVDTNTSSSSYSYYEISEATSVKVKLNSNIYGNDAIVDAKIVGKDSQTDLAVLKIDKTDLTPAEFDNSDEVKIGLLWLLVAL